MINCEETIIREVEENRSGQTQSREVESERDCPSPCNNTPTTPTTPDNKNKKVNNNKGEIKSKSFGKTFSSFCSNVFSKKTETNTSSPTVKKNKKPENPRLEQDFNMAYFIAELQMDGRSDEEIQLHLFHQRDLAQFAHTRGPKGNFVTGFFRDMQQAFKEELALRKGQTLTVSVSSMNPFSAAALSDPFSDIGFSYEDLVALESVPRGVKSVHKLPVITYTGQALPSCQTSCAICMADFEKKEELKSLQCSHHFHKECIDKWLGVATTCPVCKGEVHLE